MRTRFDQWGAKRMGYEHSSKTGAEAPASADPVGSMPLLSVAAESSKLRGEGYGFPERKTLQQRGFCDV